MPTAFRFSALAALLALAAPVRAQGLPIQLDVDYSPFMYDDEETLVEFYLGVGAQSLAYEAAEAGGYTARLPLHLVLRPTAASAPAGASATVVWERETVLQFSAADTSALQPGQLFLDRLQAAIAPGTYALDIIIPGDTTAERPEVRVNVDPVEIPDFSADDVTAIGGITLASSIRRGEDRDGVFYHNGLDVIPNPSVLFGEGLRRLNYYTEVYGVPEGVGPGPYTLYAFVANAVGAPLPGLEQRVQREARDPDVIAGSFDISTLPSGGYDLRIAVLDASNEVVAERQKRFFVVNSGVQPLAVEGAPEDVSASLFAVMDEEELDLTLRQVRALATSTELSQLTRLQSVDAKRAFLATFWRNRDDDEDPSQNMAYNDFQERLRAVERYGRGSRPGYASARGRVYLKYGAPAEVDPHPVDPNQVPHEIWVYYNIPGQTGRRTFVFADREGITYDLLYSDVIGEPSPPNWQSLLDR